MVARDGEYAVRVVSPQGLVSVLEAKDAAEQAGVDVAIERTDGGATVHFVARHQDRRLAGSALHPQALRRLVRNESVGRTESAAAVRVNPDACACG